MKEKAWLVGIILAVIALVSIAVSQSPPEDGWLALFVAVPFAIIVGVGLWLARKSQ